jgi:gamma-aminobutyric acid type B receptor
VNEVNGKVEKGAWRDIEGTEFVFFDGTATAPLPKRTVTNAHYLSSTVQIIGFCLVGLSLLFSLGTAAWVYVHRELRLVKASQPEFLYLLCFGAALVAISLVFLSFDERQGLSGKRLSSMCSAFPWFFVIGYLVMYSAIFSKLWRLSKLLSMRRRVVGVKQVLVPFCFIMAASVVVLIVWQVVDPYVWIRTEINDDPLETFGECSSRDRADDGILPYIIPLWLLFFVITSMTAVVAWRMKDVQAELSESKWIFFGIIMHIQTWTVGVPVVIITDRLSRDAWYIIMASLTFIFPTSLVALVIWPKVYVWARDKHFGGPPKQKTSVLAVMQGENVVQVSGLSLNSCQNDSSIALPTNMSISKIAELESEIATLRQRLCEAEIKDDSAPDEQAP